MNDTTYNGWTNRSTWLVNLHLSNDQATYNELRGWIARKLPVATLAGRAAWTEQTAPGTDEASRKRLALERARYELSLEVDAYVRAMVETDDATDDPASLLANDLIGTALAHVDWMEISDGWVADVVDQDEDAYAVECVECGETVDARNCAVDPDGQPFCVDCV
jgi:hypothetical protein